MASSSGAVPGFVRLAGHPLRWQLLTELARSDLRVRELVTLVGQPQNLVSYHLRLLRDGGLVTSARSSGDGRDSYYHLDLDHCARTLADAGFALHPAIDFTVQPGARVDGDAPVFPTGRRRSRRLAVLFVCTGNSARSPIAEALLRRHTAGQVDTISAGTHPKPQLHPHATRVLSDSFGVDVTAQHPRHVTTLVDRRFDYVITLCDKARDAGLQFANRPWLLHWSVADPARDGSGRDYAAFARTAADVDTRVRHLLPVLATTQERVEP